MINYQAYRLFNKYFYFICVLAFSVLLFSCGNSESELEGKVLSKYNVENDTTTVNYIPVENAHVSVQNYSDTVMTNGQGQYLLNITFTRSATELFEDKTVNIIVNKTGYKEKKHTAYVGVNRRTKIKDLVLEKE